jgi:Ca2+-binding EF-hand superfamily protein
MQISGTSTAYGGSQAQSVLSMLLQQRASRSNDGGQEMPSTDAAAPSGPPPGPPPSGASDQFSGVTLASLISAQETTPTSSDLATSMLQQSDTDGDGELSVDEIANAIGADTASGTDALTAAVNKLDTDGDGKLSADELTAGIDSAQQAQQVHGGHHGHHAHKAESSSDVASSVVSAADSDGDGALSADEITAALGDDSSSDSIAQQFKQLDTDGDGKLTTAELTAAIDAFRSANQYGSTLTTTASSTEATA